MIGIKVWIVKSWNLNIAIVNANLINCSLTTSSKLETLKNCRISNNGTCASRKHYGNDHKEPFKCLYHSQL